MEAIRQYNEYLFKDLGDHRLYHWPFMSSPWLPTGILIIYFLMIYVILPQYMRNRPAYALRKVLIVYNLTQIVWNGVIVCMMITLTWRSNYTLGCQIMDYSNEGIPLAIAKVYWWGFLLKLVGLLETSFFVLRKKSNQVSVHHVFHHASTLLLVWVITKYMPGGTSFLAILLNTFVHTFMYTYYLLSSLGGNIQKRVLWMKSKITSLQMAHLSILVFHTGQTLLPNCKYSSFLAFTVIPLSLINLYFFYKFWLSNYTKKED